MAGLATVALGMRGKCTLRDVDGTAVLRLGVLRQGVVSIVLNKLVALGQRSSIAAVQLLLVVVFALPQIDNYLD